MKAFWSGLGIGVGLGLLFAPDSGANTRRTIQDKFEEWLGASPHDEDAHHDTGARPADSKRKTGSPNARKPPTPPKKRQGRASTAADDNNAINTIGREQLMAVNGIGPVLADRIISNRPYSSTRELVERGIIGETTFRELQRELKESA